jgi:hypothetical protein
MSKLSAPLGIDHLSEEYSANIQKYKYPNIQIISTYPHIQIRLYPVHLGWALCRPKLEPELIISYLRLTHISQSSWLLGPGLEGLEAFLSLSCKQELPLPLANTSPSQTFPCYISRTLHRTTSARARYLILGSIRQ